MADLETDDIIRVNDVEWEILSRYASQTLYQMVEGLKQEYKLTAIFDGIERLERLGQQDSVLSPAVEPVAPIAVNGKHTGRIVKSDSDHFGNFHVPMSELSITIHKWLQPSQVRRLCENFTERIVHRHTRKDAARELVKVFEESLQRKIDYFRTERTLFPPIFCRRYEPDTGTMRSCVYRMGINRYDNLETALATLLAERHAPAEVESVFKHFQREDSTPTCETIRPGNGFPHNGVETNLAGVEHQQKGEI